MKPKFLIGIGIILVAVVAVMAFAIVGNSSLEVNVSDILSQQAKGVDLSQRAFKLTGVVVGSSITYDLSSLHLEFDVVNSREDLVNNLPNAQRLRVVYEGVKPDTLVDEAHAIVTGKLAVDGKFHAAHTPDSLLLQCPTKYQDTQSASK